MCGLLYCRNQPEEVTTCKGCDKKMNANNLRKHFGRVRRTSNCELKYSTEDLENIKRAQLDRLARSKAEWKTKNQDKVAYISCKHERD